MGVSREIDELKHGSLTINARVLKLRVPFPFHAINNRPLCRYSTPRLSTFCTSL